MWERFGHNALWVRDNTQGTDWAFDYGRFSFGRTVGQQLGFFAKFASGHQQYWMGDGDARAYLAAYQQAGRAIWAQELDLPPAARVAVRDFLLWNIQEDHKYYHYDYFLDNCSTRIRDVIDRAVAGQLKVWAEGVETPMTYRDHTRRTTQNGPVAYTALMLGLGRPVDRPLSAWQEMFLPISLRPYLNQVQVTDADGRRHPLVKSERQLVATDRYRVEATPADWTWRYAGLGVVVGLVLAWLGAASRREGWGRRVFKAAGGAWCVFAGFGGAVLIALWAVTGHLFSYRNENVLQLNVASLLLLWVLPGAIRGEAGRGRTAERLAWLVAGLSAAGLLLKPFPGSQANLDMIAWILPVHLGLAAGLRRRGRG